MSTIPFGWWLYERNGSRPGAGTVKVRQAELFSSVQALTQWANDPNKELVGLTSDPRDVVAWINDGTLPPKDAPVRGS